MGFFGECAKLRWNLNGSTACGVTMLCYTSHLWRCSSMGSFAEVTMDVGAGGATQRRGLAGGQDAMQGLASYAKQSKDEGLYKVASRIQARAIRRCGELLRDFDARGENDGATVVSPTKAVMTPVCQCGKE